MVAEIGWMVDGCDKGMRVFSGEVGRTGKTGAPSGKRVCLKELHQAPADQQVPQSSLQTHPGFPP